MRRLLPSIALACLIVVGGFVALGPAADDPKFVPIGPPRPDSIRSPALSAEAENQAISLVRQHVPDLAQVLDRLKGTNPAEYGKAIGELAAEARTLADLRAKNPARADLALDAWKARTHVELIAAQLASSPSVERESQLRAAIEARVDVDIRRHRFEVEQNTVAVAKAREHLARTEANLARNREALARIEQNRAAKVENRFRALLPKKPVAPTAAKASTRSVISSPASPAPTQEKSR